MRPAVLTARRHDAARENRVTREHRIGLLKMLPGLAISAFFIWWTYIRVPRNGQRGFNVEVFRGLHLVSPAWAFGVVAFGVAGYTLRSVRAWAMLRHTGARFATCARVLMTSLAANNVLPLRIGDVMRIFTYAQDVNATPSTVLSTVILEKLLDVFSLAILLAGTMHFGSGVSDHIRTMAEVCVVISTAGLLVMVFGANALDAQIKRFSAKTQNAIVKKIEHWLTLALGCMQQIGVAGSLMLVGYSFAAWLCECMMYVALARAIGLATDAVGPWQATAEANLSFLIPSSPGGIGPFEVACKDALVRHGTDAASAGLFGLLMHLWLLLSITAVGGAMFFAHRLRRNAREPLIQEINELPVQLP
jgi:uncharacterized protein (TIRG00374 family)